VREQVFLGGMRGGAVRCTVAVASHHLAKPPSELDDTQRVPPFPSRTF
jgi:hypothetical protein